MPDHESSSARHLANAMRADDIGSPQEPGATRTVVWFTHTVYGAGRWLVRRVWRRRPKA